MVGQALRVALVGLSAKPAGFGWVNHIHLPYLLTQPNIQITAVLGSSKAAAEAAIARNSLPSSVRAYGSPEELAHDDSVDLVVVGVPAHLHRSIILPSLRAGKGLVVEWPIDISFSESQEIVELAHAKGLRTAVDIQGRFSKIIEQVAEVVNSGRIGRVLSTSVSGGVPTGGAEPENVGVKYSLQDGSGATIVDIHLAHILECLTHIHGPVRSVSSLIKTMRPTTDIVDMSTGEILEKDVEKSAPDQILVHGELVHGGAINIHLHGGVGIGGATWNIIGEKGEIVLSAPALIPWINAPNPWKLKILDSSGITEEDVHEDEPGKQLAVNRLWDTFLAGKSDTWPDFAHALSIQKVIDAIKRSNTEKVTVILEQHIV